MRKRKVLRLYLFSSIIKVARGIASGYFIFFLYHTHFYLLHDFMHGMVQQQHDKEIGNAMQDIVGNACHPPVECHDKTAFDAASHSADYDIGQGTICPKQSEIRQQAATAAALWPLRYRALCRFWSATRPAPPPAPSARSKKHISSTLLFSYFITQP